MKNSLMSLLLLMLIGASACAGNSDYPAPPAYAPHPGGEFPISACYAFYQPLINDRQFQWVKEAGFNSIMQRLGFEDLDSCLVLARKYGLNVFVNMPEIRDPAKTKSIVDRYRDNPTVWDFTVFDEPKTSQFPLLAKVEEIIAANAPTHNGFINLLPAVSPKDLGASSYRDYVESYVREVNPPFISFDIYPVKVDGRGKIYVDDCLYRTVEVVADVTRQSGRPFWSFVLSNKHWMYPKPTREFLRFQVFTFLAYGAQALTYYTYGMPDFDKGKGEYSYAPIDWEGNRTEVWYMVRDVNREVRNLSKVFLNSEVLGVTQTGLKIPEGTVRNYRVPAPFSMIESYGEGVTVSHIRNGNKEYLVIVNRDVLSSQRVRLSRTRSVVRLYGDGKEKEDKGPYFTLDPGGYAIFRLN